MKQVFSWSAGQGQLSEVKLDGPDALAKSLTWSRSWSTNLEEDSVYKPSLHDGEVLKDVPWQLRNQGNKEEFFNTPDIPEKSDQNSNVNG